MGYRNEQRNRARREHDPGFVQAAMIAEIMAVKDTEPDLQNLDVAELIDAWMPEWLDLVGRDGPGRPSQGRGGLRHFLDGKFVEIRKQIDQELD